VRFEVEILLLIRYIVLLGQIFEQDSLGWDVAQVVECQIGKCKTLSSNPITAKKKKRIEKKKDLSRIYVNNGC
jgi:hypothetical protein